MTREGCSQSTTSLIFRNFALKKDILYCILAICSNFEGCSFLLFSFDNPNTRAEYKKSEEEKKRKMWSFSLFS